MSLWRPSHEPRPRTPAASSIPTASPGGLWRLGAESRCRRPRLGTSRRRLGASLETSARPGPALARPGGGARGPGRPGGGARRAGHPGGVGEEGMRVLAGVEARGRCPVADWRVSRLRARGCAWEGVEAEESRRDFSGTGAWRGGSGPCRGWRGEG